MTTDRRARLVAAARGVAAGSCGLAVAQVGSRLVDATPPLQALGDLVVRVTPSSGARTTIDAVGNHDKTILRLAVLLVAASLAAAVGRLHAAGRVRAAVGAVVALALAPVLAVATAPTGSVLRELVVMVVGALVGVVVLHVLARPALRERDLARTQDRVGRDLGQGAEVARALDRRQLLRAGGLAVIAAAAGEAAFRALRRPPASLTRRLREALPAVPRPLAALSDELPGATPLLSRELYRVDTALELPFVDPDSWRLAITREGQQVAELTYDQLRAVATTEADITIGCVDNVVGGDLVGAARWQGVLLSRLLADLPRAGRVRAVSTDGFVASFPVSFAADGRPSMVAVGMNGRTLPIRHGFPARLVVPGLYGFTSAVKWLAAIDVSTQDGLPGFWADRGWTPGATVRMTSRIDTPVDGRSLDGGSQRIAGIAWAPVSGVGAVEVQVDEGPWQPARLSAFRTGSLWRQWSLDWDAVEGDHALRVRVTDRDGAQQDDTGRSTFPAGATGLHRIRVSVR